MAYQRRGKTYISAAKKAEMEAAEEAKVEGKARPRRRRRPPPRFSDLFIKKKEEEEEQSKENINIFSSGSKAEEIFNDRQASWASRKPLGAHNSLTSSTNSVPSFSDTFDKLISKPSCATQSQIPRYLCSSSSSSCENHLDSSGILFKSLLSKDSNLTTDTSSGWGSRLRNCKSQAQQENSKVKPERKHNESPSEESQKPSTEPVYSPQLFVSSDMIVDESSETSVSTSPQPRTKTLRQRTRGKQALYRQRTTKPIKGVLSSEAHTTRSTSRTNCVADVSGGEPTSRLLPKVKPSPLVQRFLNSLGITHTPPVQNSLLGPTHIPHQNTMSSSPPVSGKSSGKSSVHTSTPTERSKWSDHSSPSLEIKVSPVPRQEDMVTDNSSLFQSLSPPTGGNRGQFQGDLGGSPSLPSKYETCISLERFREDTNSTNKQYVTGETCDSEKDSASPDYDSNSNRITHRMFKVAKVPKITFESPAQQEPPVVDSLPCGSELPTDQILLHSEPSVIIGRRTRAGKAIKRLESSQNSSTTQSPKVFTTGRNGKAFSSLLAKRFSPMLTRRRSKLLAQQSDESCSTDLSHFRNSISSSCISEEDQKSWFSDTNHKHRKNVHRGNMLHRKSRKIAAQKTQSTVDTDESINDILPPLERSKGVERRSAQRTSIVSRSGNRSSQGLPPIARRSVRLSRKTNPVKISLPTRKSKRQLGHGHSASKRLEHSTSRNSSKGEASLIHVPSDCSSIFNFKPSKARRNNQLIFQKRSLCQSSTLTSVDSWPEDSHSEPPIHSNSKQHTEDTYMGSEDLQMATGKESSGPGARQPGMMSGGVVAQYDLREPVVMLTRLEESADISMESVGASNPLPALPALPAKPGKGWRRSIAIQARAASLTSAKDGNDMPLIITPTRSPGPHRKMSGLRITSFPLELNHRHHRLQSADFLDSPRRSVLQMSFCTKAVELSALPAPAPDPRQQVLELCSQVEPVPLTHCFTESRLACCRKIGEGVYGEVFMTRPNSASLEGSTVFKVMPIEGDFLVNGEPQKKFEEILSEMVISLELSSLRAFERQSSMTQNFVHVLGCWCVEGCYPQDLLHLWDLHNEEKGSENDRPDIFPDTQLYVVLEFGHGGRDLESFVFNNARDLMAVFLQIAYSLAVAEEALEFEHRDLHWGNVLVAPTTESKIDFKLGGAAYTLNTYGLKATVIDFTLSRIKMPHCIVFNNLAEDPSLFTSEGDYQFEVYRQMQHANNNTWETFTPYTNVLWLHYLLVKMTSQCYIKNSKTKLHRIHHTLLTKLRDAMLSYESATHFVHSRESQE